MEEKENLPIKTESKKKVNKKRLMKILAGFLLIAMFGYVINYKSKHPEFSSISLYLLIIVLIFLGVLVVFYEQIVKRIKNFKKDHKKDEGDDLPKSETPEEMFSILKNHLAKPYFDGGYENHIKALNGRRVKFIGGNQIFHFQVVPLFKDTIDNIRIETIDYIFNSHFPENFQHTSNLTIGQIASRMNEISKNPRIEALEEFRVYDPISGRESITKKSTTQTKKPKKVEEPKIET